MGRRAFTKPYGWLPWCLSLWRLGGYAYSSFLPSFEEPIELRTVHPAPPATTKVHGKTFVLQTAENPYRLNPEGKYDQEYTDAHIVSQDMGRLMKDFGSKEDNPWDPNAEGYIKYVREGARFSSRTATSAMAII